MAYSTLNRGSAPLDLNDEYWAMRDAIVQAELLITRTLSFDLNIELAHKVSEDLERFLCLVTLSPFRCLSLVFAILHEDSAGLGGQRCVELRAHSQDSCIISAGLSSQRQHLEIQAHARGHRLPIAGTANLWGSSAPYR